MVMSVCAGMGDSVLRDRLPALWRRIEDAHYSYLEIDDSPEKLQQKKKLEGYILEYLTLVPHECKFGLAETGKIFQRTVNELADYSAYRAGIGWAAVARYAANLLAQPWRKEYQIIRTYSGFYKHEVEANMCGAESILQALGYKPIGNGRLALDGPVCPDMAAAVSRDAIIAHCECQIMVQIWESVWGNGNRVSWSEVARDRSKHASAVAFAVARLSGYTSDADIYSNVPATSSEHQRRLNDPQYLHCSCPEQILEEPIQPVINPYMVPNMIPPNMMYPMQHMNNDIPVTVPQCNTVTMMTPYGPVPYYYPVQAPYMIPTPVYAPIKHATNVPINGFPPISQYRYPPVPTAQLIELDAPSVYENGKFERSPEDRSHRKSKYDGSKRSTSKSGFSEVSIPSLSRSDTQPSLSKAKEDGMGTYESWDYVFRNLSSKDQEGDSKSGFSQSLDRDSRTLDRLDREERRSKYQPTTLDLEDGLQALNLDRSYDEEMYRTAKVNENLMRLKQEQERKTRQLAKRQTDDRKPRKSIDHVGNPKADGLITPKVAPDKVKLLTKKDIKDRKDTIKQQSSMNGSVANTAEVKKVKKPSRLVAGEAERPKSISENGLSKVNSSKSTGSTSTQSQQPNHSNYDLKAQLIVSLDEPDTIRRSPPKHVHQNGDRERSASRTSQHDRQETDEKKDKWQCGTCTYLNKGGLVCEICGKSKKGPEIEPLTSGGRECPACTLVNKRDARSCDACGTSLQHCPTYI